MREAAHLRRARLAGLRPGSAVLRGHGPRRSAPGLPVRLLRGRGRRRSPLAMRPPPGSPVHLPDVPQYPRPGGEREAGPVAGQELHPRREQRRPGRRLAGRGPVPVPARPHPDPVARQAASRGPGISPRPLLRGARPGPAGGPLDGPGAGRP